MSDQDLVIRDSVTDSSTFSRYDLVVLPRYDVVLRVYEPTVGMSIKMADLAADESRTSEDYVKTIIPSLVKREDGSDIGEDDALRMPQRMNSILMAHVNSMAGGGADDVKKPS